MLKIGNIGQYLVPEMRIILGKVDHINATKDSFHDGIPRAPPVLHNQRGSVDLDLDPVAANIVNVQKHMETQVQHNKAYGNFAESSHIDYHALKPYTPMTASQLENIRLLSMNSNAKVSNKRILEYVDDGFRDYDKGNFYYFDDDDDGNGDDESDGDDRNDDVMYLNQLVDMSKYLISILDTRNDSATAVNGQARSQSLMFQRPSALSSHNATVEPSSSISSSSSASLKKDRKAS